MGTEAITALNNNMNLNFSSSLSEVPSFEFGGENSIFETHNAALEYNWNMTNYGMALARSSFMPGFANPAFGNPFINPFMNPVLNTAQQQQSPEKTQARIKALQAAIQSNDKDRVKTIFEGKTVNEIADIEYQYDMANGGAGSLRAALRGSKFLNMSISFGGDNNNAIEILNKAACSNPYNAALALQDALGKGKTIAPADIKTIEYIIKYSTPGTLLNVIDEYSKLTGNKNLLTDLEKAKINGELLKKIYSASAAKYDHNEERTTIIQSQQSLVDAIKKLTTNSETTASGEA